MIEYALSIRQPWAWAILNLGKDVENREWSTGLRGRIWVSASQTMDVDGYAYILASGRDLPPMDSFERGGIVGSVEITGCVKESESDWFFGPYGFTLANPEKCEFTPCRGLPKFFKPVISGNEFDKWFLKQSKKECVMPKSKVLLFCAVLNGKRTAITADGRKVGEWAVEEALGTNWPRDKVFLDVFAEALGKRSYTIENVEDPGAHEQFIAACALMEKAQQEAENPPAAEAPAGDQPPVLTTTEIIHLDLAIPYPPEKLAEFGASIMDLYEEMKSIEEEKKRSNDRFKARLDDVEESMEAVSKKYHEGSAMGPVECTCTKDAAGKILSCVRNDNGEEVPDVQQTSLNVPEAEEEAPAPALLELSSLDAEGALRNVDIVDDKGEWLGLDFGALVEGEIFRLTEKTGYNVEIDGHSEFVAMGAPYANAEGVLVINAVVQNETKPAEGEPEAANSETVEPEGETITGNPETEAADAEMAEVK